MKQLFLRTCLSVLALFMAASSFAYDFEVDGIYYEKILDEISDEITVTVTSGDVNYSGDVTIPSSVTNKDNGKTYSVTAIGEDAFWCCYGLTSIEIPSSVTSIGRYAFGYCYCLTSIEIPSSVTSIGEYAFYKCSGLTSITVDPANTAYDSHNNCNAIIRKSDNTLIAGCQNTVIPSSVTSIGGYAFYDCSGLTTIEIPSSVTSIGYDAFYGCSGLISIEIPSSVTSIGRAAFSGCSGLTSIKVDAANTVYDSRDNCNAIIETSSNSLIAGCQNSVIPSSVTSIGSYAFGDCTGLTSVEIPSSVTEIGYDAFYGCKGLTSIEIPSSVTEIGGRAFGNCSGLISMKVDAANTVYDSRDNSNAIIEKATNTLIAGCQNTVIPPTVKTIGPYAFYSTGSTASLYIPSSVSKIDKTSFYYCVVDIYCLADVDFNCFQYLSYSKHLYVERTKYDQLMASDLPDNIKSKLVLIDPHSIIPESGQLWWGYFSNQDISSFNNKGGIGWSASEPETLDVAVRISDDKYFVPESTIKAVSIWLKEDVAKITQDMKIWISTSLVNDLSNAEFVQTVPQSSLQEGMNEIKLNKPFSVKQLPLYVGYTIMTSGKAFPIGRGGDDVQDAFFYKNSSQDWEDISMEGVGKLALQVLVDGGNYPRDCVTADDFAPVVTLQGEEVSVPLIITNKGENPVTSVSYTVAINGSKVSDERLLNLGYLQFNSSATVNIPLPVSTNAQRNTEVVTITKVKGVANKADDKTATGSVLKLAYKPEVVPVVEEFTGTWCGYCPYGIVGMSKAHETFGDKVVLIAAHSGDVMETSAYKEVINTFASGYPSAYSNRESNLYPSSSTVISRITSAFNRTTLGDVSLTAAWTDESETAIDFYTTTRFAYDDDKGNYGIAFVLTEDGMSGTGSSWAQANFLSGEDPSGDEEMAFWYSAASRVTGLEYDHVAVDGWGVTEGIDGSVSKKFRTGQAMNYRYRANIGDNSLIQDKKKLKAIALLIDRDKGNIVNAAQSEVAHVPTGISAVQANGDSQAKVVGYYSIDGKKLTTPQRGINIVRMSDGTTHKVLVK